MVLILTDGAQAKVAFSQISKELNLNERQLGGYLTLREGTQWRGAFVSPMKSLQLLEVQPAQTGCHADILAMHSNHHPR